VPAEEEQPIWVDDASVAQPANRPVNDLVPLAPLILTDNVCQHGGVNGFQFLKHRVNLPLSNRKSGQNDKLAKKPLFSFHTF
jgi:hypothetical protein